MLLKWLTGLVIVFGLTYEAFGLDVVPGEYKGEQVIFVSGEYFEYDEDVLFDVTDAYPDIKTIVLTDSEGGVTAASYPIAKFLKDEEYKTIAIGDCVSSCGIVWLGGTERVVTDGGVVKLHLPYTPAEDSLEFFQNNEFCKKSDPEDCKMLDDLGRLEMYLIWNLEAVGKFYDFMVEMEAEPEWISGTMQTNPWNFYQITGE